VGRWTSKGVVSWPLAFAGRGSEARRFVRFLVVGVLNTAVGYAIFALFTLAGLGLVPSTVGATVIGALFNFKSIGQLVFGASGAKLLPRFLAVYVLQCAANIAALRSFASVGVPVLYAEAIILPVLAVAGFLLMRLWVFRNVSGAVAASPRPTHRDS
jgi:putative flippase GtrA